MRKNIYLRYRPATRPHFVFGIALLVALALLLGALPPQRAFAQLDTDGDGVPNATDLDDDNDGILDVDEGGNDIIFFRQTNLGRRVDKYAIPGNGTISAGVALAQPVTVDDVGTDATEFTFAADVNGDGFVDLVTFNQTTSNYIDVFRGTLSGFSEAVRQTISIQDVGIASNQSSMVGDMNADGFLDLVHLNETDNKIYIYRGNGDGTFQNVLTQSISIARGGQSVTGTVLMQDTNGDGADDILVLTQNGATSTILDVYRSDGSTAFLAPTSTTYTPSIDIGGYDNSEHTLVGDIDLDGHADLVSMNASPQNFIVVLKGNGDGTFQNPVTQNTTVPNVGFDTNEWLTLVDVSGDGVLDILALSAGGYAYLWRNLGNGTFAGYTSIYPSGGIPDVGVDGGRYTMLAAHDIDTDSDGTIDSLDSDADGDSCVDALEGSAGLSSANIDGNGRITGGVNGAGVPLLTPGGQSVHESRTALISSACGDTDGDGIGDLNDVDDDGDGITDTLEGGNTLDSDGDGLPNRFDLDSDNDGIRDVDEAGGLTDANDDGMADGTDANSNGIIDSAPGTLLDTDSDGTANVLDLDSDGDICVDAIEGDGAFDAAFLTGAGMLIGGQDEDGVPAVSSNGQGIGLAQDNAQQDPDCATQTDTDGDGTFDSADQCPTTPAGGVVNPTTGCPYPSTLQLDKTANVTMITAGAPFTYTITLTNTGAEAHNVIIRDSVPMSLTINSTAITCDTAVGTANVSGQEVLAGAGLLADGERCQLTITVTKP